MKMRFLGTNSDDGSCPALYATDRGTYVVQGYTVTDPSALSQMTLLEGEAVVEVPAALLRKVFGEAPQPTEPAAKLAVLRSTSGDGDCPALYATGRDTHLVQGRRVTDPEALAHARNILDGEEFVEVPRELLSFAEAGR